MDRQNANANPPKKGLSRKAKMKKLQQLLLMSLALNFVLLLVILVMAAALMNQAGSKDANEKETTPSVSIGVDEETESIPQSADSLLNTEETTGDTPIIYYIDP